MKSFIITCLFASFAIASTAQALEGTIVYEDKINIHKNLPPEMEAMKANIPEFRSSNHLLYFTKEETFYTKKAEEKKENEFRRGGRRGFMRGGGNKTQVYTNLTEKLTKSSQDLFGKQFLISGTPKDFKWKITGEQKQVGSYLCQKASFQDSTTQIEVWFTPMIPVSAGPGKYSGLPGLILHVDIDDGMRQITAQDILLDKLAEGLIVQPTEGKEISQEEYQKLREEKMKEMEAEWGGKGRKNKIFRRRN